uniref:Uncharacterized protein n=1 Tax=Oryza sativa subsp. japonica TaxID=39947 RepID=Q6Z646_ORYSJ|nr:hypothetical protein [Oryza sativa Japonica Group]
MRRISHTHSPLSPARARARDGRDSNSESRLSLHLHLPHVGRRIMPLLAMSEFPLPYISSTAIPSLFFPISPNSLVVPIAPAPCIHPLPPFPPLRPPLAAARLAATPRRRLRWFEWPRSTPSTPPSSRFAAGAPFPPCDGESRHVRRLRPAFPPSMAPLSLSNLVLFVL